MRYDAAAIITIIYITLVMIALPAAIFIPYFFPHAADFFITGKVDDTPNFDINYEK